MVAGSNMVSVKQMSPFIISYILVLIFLSAVLFIRGSFMVIDYNKRISGCNFSTTKFVVPKTCESIQNQCEPDGSEALPRSIVHRTTDLEMRPLAGPSNTMEKLKSPMSLLAMAVGIEQKENVNKIVTKFMLNDFAIMLFHYDGNVNDWSDLEWSKFVVHVSAINQTKWWFFKRFLHPDIIAQYDYVFLWDEYIGVENFHSGRYLSVIKEKGLQISQPAIGPAKSKVHYKLTETKTSSKFHRFVEMMAPVISRASWRCVWDMIQNDLVHGWGLDNQLGYCARENMTANIGTVDSEYVIRLGLPSTLFGSMGNDVRKESDVELDKFENRWEKAVREDECWVDPFHQ